DALSEFTFEAGMEWMALGLARAGREVPGLDDYLKSVEDYINEKANDSEQLANASSTNSRFILALTALAQDATKFADHDLIKGLSDLTYVGKQGLNGYTWALLALDSHEYEEAEGATATREAMVEAILAKQHEDGGWSLTDTYPNSDVDITAMTLQALAPYYSKDANVKAAIDKALEFLSGKQNQYGGFGSVDGASVESCAQVIVALTALGIDPSEDERFVKNDWSVTDALSSYYLGEGKFSHTPGAAYNGLATEQAYYAMASYFRFKDGQTSLYDMTDVEFAEEYETPEGPIVKITDKDGSEVKFSYADIEAGVKLTKPVAISVNDELDEGDEIDITWQRDIVVPEDTKFPVTVEFAVDEKDQEKTVYIYHYDAEKKVWEVVGSGKGKTVTAKFDSLSPGAMVTRTDEAPNTGDASRMFLWAAMIVAAAAAGTAAMLTGRKRKED
ncbi:MAG: terpene cyclase/mutase family protein, partial [Firmicutes bacterium]|nr:terpene cyclase/mutase family protein [Bacillota bacterium]